MKKTSLLLATVTAVGLGMSAPAFAQGALTEQPMEDVNVSAERLPPNAPVAVSGTVGEFTRGGLIINGLNGPVKVTLANRTITNSNGSYALTRHFSMGDSITAFGGLRHGEMVSVQPEAILLHTAPAKAELIMLQESKLQSMQKLNKPMNARATLNALQDKYRDL